MNAAELEQKTREIANLALAIAGQLAGVRSVTADGITITLPTLDSSGAIVGALSLETAVRAWKAICRSAPQSAREALARLKAQAGVRGVAGWDMREDVAEFQAQNGATTEKSDDTSAGEIVVAVFGFLGGLLDAVTGKKDAGTGTGGTDGGSKPPGSNPPSEKSGLAAVPTWAWAVGGLVLVMVLTGRVPAAR
jgi:hypothetical protein